MKRVFISGKINDNNCTKMLQNIRRGISIANKVLKLGFAPFCPHLDFLYSLTSNNSPTLEEFRAYCLAWVKVSDILLIVDEDESTWSEGVKLDYRTAISNKITVICGFDYFKELVDEGKILLEDHTQ